MLFIGKESYGKEFKYGKSAKRVKGRSSNTESKTTFLEVFSPQLNVAMEILIKHNAGVLNIVHGPWLNYTSVNGI